MQYGVIITTGDPRSVADLAAEAEAAGWDGVFYFDAIAIGAMELSTHGSSSPPSPSEPNG